MTKRETELLDKLHRVTVAYRDMSLFLIRNYDCHIEEVFPEQIGLGGEATELVTKYEAGK